MRLLLILPTQPGDDGRPIRKKKASVALNLNLALLAGYAPQDVEVRIVNDFVEEVDLDWPCDLVGITTLISCAPRAYQLGDEFRRRGAKVVMGGFHASWFPEEAARHCDAVVIGEADELWPQVIDDFRSGRLHSIYKAEEFPKLTGLPVPRYDLINQKQYQVEVYPVESSRGCPFSCEYCAVTKFHGGVHRLRPVGEVIRDIKATGSRYIVFVDDNIIGNKEHALELFQAMIPLNIRWMAQSTMLMADDQKLLDAAVRSGMRLAWVGVESIDAQALAEVHRKINQVDEFERRIREFQKRGVLVGANMMFGFDHETREHYERTYEFVARNRVIPFLYILTPIPGTDLFTRLEKEGRILTHDWAKYTSYQTVYQPKSWSPQEQDDMYFKMAVRLFNFKNNFLRTFPGIQLNNLKESFFIRLAAFIIGMGVGHALRCRNQTHW